MDSPTGSDRRRLRSFWTDADMDRIISFLLRAGLAAAAAIVLVGAVIYLARHGGETADYRVFQGEPPQYRQVAGIFREMEQLRGRGFILAGLLVLMGTPVLRVAFSVVAFFRQRDYIYVFVTLFVLAVLLFSLLRSG